MKYFFDTEFLEGTKTISKTHSDPTIDLISIGITNTNGNTYYAISNEFDIYEAWYRNDSKDKEKDNYWIRNNVLYSIFREYVPQKATFNFTLDNFKACINKIGKPKKTIKEEITHYVYNDYTVNGALQLDTLLPDDPIEFYGYYGNYDWVVFCWIFGRMLNLPKGFPMFSNDLKVTLNEAAKIYDDDQHSNLTLESKLKYLKTNSKYPTQSNEHNSLDDAKWNKKLYEFINTLN